MSLETEKWFILQFFLEPTIPHRGMEQGRGEGKKERGREGKEKGKEGNGKKKGKGRRKWKRRLLEFWKSEIPGSVQVYATVYTMNFESCNF